MAQVKYKIGDKLEVIGDTGEAGHEYDTGTLVEIIRVQVEDDNRVAYDTCNKPSGNCWWVYEDDLQEIGSNITIKQDNSSMKLMKQAVKDTALRLCQANNTVTTLEIKTELRKTHPYFHWIQNSKSGLTGVSEYMEELYQEGGFSYADGGTHRVYSAMGSVPVKRGRPRKTAPVATPVAVKIPNPNHNVRSISRQKALDMMVNNKGHFFTATFIKQNGDRRTINCQYMKDQKTNPVGYVMVKEAGKMKQGVNAVRQINLQTLENIRIGGQNYNIRK